MPPTPTWSVKGHPKGETSWLARKLCRGRLSPFWSRILTGQNVCLVMALVMIAMVVITQRPRASKSGPPASPAPPTDSAALKRQMGVLQSAIDVQQQRATEGDSDAQERANELEKLYQKLAELEARNQELEARVKALAAAQGSSGSGDASGMEEGTASAESPEPASAHHGIQRGLGPQNERQEAVVEAFRWAWKAYREVAWGHDLVRPVRRVPDKWTNVGLTLVDSLDTMLLMGLESEYEEARQWVASSLNFEYNDNVNLFETTIRIVGGLLSAYHISGDDVYLDKTVDLADRLMAAFDSPSGIPYSDVNPQRRSATSLDAGLSSLAEVTSIQLEFGYLSYATGDTRYADAAGHVMDMVLDKPSEDGLLGARIDTRSGSVRGERITLGARGDSYYEYLLKQYLQTRHIDSARGRRCLARYRLAVQGIRKHLLSRTRNDRLLMVGERAFQKFSPKMDHLVCFLPGTLALGAIYGDDGDHSQDLVLAEELMYTCVQMYRATATGLAPEIVYFDAAGPRSNMPPYNEHADDIGVVHRDVSDAPDAQDTPVTQDINIHPNDVHNLLRPETLESLYYLYRITGKDRYRRWGWEIFQAFQTHSRVPTGGYTSLQDCSKVPPVVGNRDLMESFFLSETLKYAFLLQAPRSPKPEPVVKDDHTDAIVPWDGYVFNTEGHPLPVFEGAL